MFRRLAVAMLFTLTGIGAANAYVPTQFIARMYTDVLGRAPDPSGWNGALGYFQPNGCIERHAPPKSSN